MQIIGISIRMRRAHVEGMTLALLALFAAPWHADVEVDPTAYVLDGSSIHVGIGYDRWRLDAGNFALDMPAFTHTPGFDVGLTGYGLKLQLFPWETGAFVGVDTAVARFAIERDGMIAHETDVQLGVHAGYRIDIAHGFYATPWLGVGYLFGAHDVALAGRTFHAEPVTVFPAVHLGYQFQ